jgi:hypothetical protein
MEYIRVPWNVSGNYTYTLKKIGILPNFEDLALFYETILGSVAWKSFRNFYREPFEVGKLKRVSRFYYETL